MPNARANGSASTSSFVFPARRSGAVISRRKCIASVVFTRNGASRFAFAAQSSHRSASPGESSVSSVPRPIEIRKNRLHCIRVCRLSSSYTAGRSAAVWDVTRVFTWTGSPASAAVSSASMVASNVPGTIRTPSWYAAVEPSSDNEIAWMPTSFIQKIRSRVSSGVTAGASETPMPRSVAAAISSGRSGRRSGSPPVITTCGSASPGPAKPSRSSSTAIASAVVSSPGIGSGMAVARQCRQASPQALVSSQ